MKESFESPRWESETTDDSIEAGVLPSELNLAHADALLERLEALNELSDTDKMEAERMIDELDEQRKLREHARLPIPERLNHVIGELREFVLGATRSVREMYAHEAAELAPLPQILSDASTLELELIEREAAGTLQNTAEDLKKRINEVLPQLDTCSGAEGDEIKNEAKRLKETLSEFDRVLGK
jgi:hypothetical protein